MKPAHIFEVFEDRKGKIYTKALVPGAPFNEKTKAGFREWDPRRSKLGAMIKRGSKNIGIRKDNYVLYLGSAHGYTASYISDMVGENGLVFCVDPAPRVTRDLVLLSQKRRNLIPLLCDANKPETYATRVPQVDIIIQDIAQRNQLEIFLKNVEEFLAPGGYALLSIKARSIDITKRPKQIFTKIRLELENKITVIDYKTLDPYQKDHAMIIVKK